MWVGLTLAYHLASRLAYVVGVGVALTAQDRRQIFTRGADLETGFRRFRRIASTLMLNDGVSFVLLSVVTRATLSPTVFPRTATVVGGAIFILLGASTKLWAAWRLGTAAYYWHNFFAAGDRLRPNPPGPYRFLRNPMYTVGYLHIYGFALVCGSFTGLIAAAFDQTAILVFYHVVEKPHFDRLVNDAAERSGQPVPPT
jgi:protein-S-isoprenylcysteine O-methyltransferase Ste14